MAALKDQSWVTGGKINYGPFGLGRIARKTT